MNRDRNLSNAPHLVAIAVLAGLLSSGAPALPGDRDREITVEALSSEVRLDDEIAIYRGSEEQPAVARQGSLEVRGLEITIERREGELHRIVVSGDPARFQHQPDEDGEVVHGTGGLLVYDDTAQLLTVSESARLTREGNELTAHEIQYDLEARTVRAASGDSADRVQMVIPPDNPD